MKLTELEPTFLTSTGEGSHRQHDDIATADGIMFLCPVCFAKNNGPVGTHSIICWQPHVDPEIYPKPGRWQLLGTGYEDLELKAGSSSVQLNGGCNAHFFVRGGEIIIC